MRTAQRPAGADIRRGSSHGSPARARRAFARRQWRRRLRVWRVVLAALLLLGLVAGGIWLVFFSTGLSVAGVQVQGASVLQPGQIRAAAGVPLGGPVATADLSAIEARVEALAAVDQAEVSRQWPDEVLITVRERKPVAVVRIGGQARGMDGEGVVFREYAREPRGLPRVRTGTDTPTDALREAAGVIAALPPGIARRVEYIEVATVDQISLSLRDGRTVRWGSADASDDKARVLAALLARRALAYDVSVPGQPTTRG